LKACLRGNMDDIKRVGCVDGRMGYNNVNIWMEK